jgi:hypothetical protein
MISASIMIVPEAANAAVETNVMVVTLLLIAPLSVDDTGAGGSMPPQPPEPQPTLTVFTSEPVVIWYAPTVELPPAPTSEAFAATVEVIV